MYQFLQWFGSIAGLFFCFVSGSVVGSFLNVVVYRLPAGINLIYPPSRCPHCETPLSFRENLPIIGWLRIRGRCAYCHTKISPEYPIVEFITACLFALIFLLWFMNPSVLPLIGINADFWRPDWAAEGFWDMWPTYLLACALVSTLIAVTLIDARTYHIHLALPWLLGALGIVIHPLHAAVIGHPFGTDHPWVIPTVGHPWLGGVIGATLGLALSALLLKLGVMPRSFSDYEEWENQALARKNQPPEGKIDPPEHPRNEGNEGIATILVRTLALTGPAVAGLFLGAAVGLSYNMLAEGAGFGFAIGLLIGLVLRNLVVRRQATPLQDDDTPAWLDYPHARREMLKEILFLLPPAVFFALFWWFLPPFDTPVWVLALGGSLLGMLAGAGVVWCVRIFGTLAFGREAMGMGDVHLMGGVGAVVGWIDVTLAFFIAPFLGIAWFLLSMVFKKTFERQGQALPFGPQLAAATVLVVIGKPVLVLGLSWIAGGSVDLP